MTKKVFIFVLLIYFLFYYWAMGYNNRKLFELYNNKSLSISKLHVRMIKLERELKILDEEKDVLILAHNDQHKNQLEYLREEIYKPFKLHYIRIHDEPKRRDGI